ncbi:MAG: SprB repeat-containing protein, partial [Bacteroidia bacterium]|nr:SprB repeat-containing protein [Bacteroidia bacterium]
MTAGVYTVIVSDANGCSIQRSYNVGEASAIVSSLSTDPAVCFNAASGRAIIQISGGTAPYRLLWSNGTVKNVQTNAQGIARDTLFNLAAGDYSVTVVDAAGCNHVRTFSIGRISDPFVISEVIANDVSCTAAQATGGSERDGVISIYVEGPSQTYTYFVSNGLQQFTIVADNPGVFTNLPAGNYTVWARDVNGCVVSYPFVVRIGVPPPIEITGLARTNVSCHGLSDGRASVSVIGGTPFAVGAPYRYVWSSLYDPFYQDFGSEVSGLSPGLYRVTVFDSKGCFAVSPYFEIRQPAAPLSVSLQVTDLVCSENSDGRIRALVTGGTQPYTYYWASSDVPFLDLSANSPEISNLPPGNYSVVVVDANDCFVTAAASISNPISFSASVVNITPTTVCDLDPIVDPITGETIYPRGNGSITIQLNNASNPPYRVEIVPSPYGFSQSFVENLGGGRYRINFLAAGRYEIRVRDNLGCLGTTVNPLVVTLPSPNGIAGL